MQRKAMTDAELLFRTAFRDFAHVSVDGIKQLRNSHKLQVILDMEEEKRREREWEEQQLAREKARQRLSVGPQRVRFYFILFILFYFILLFILSK